MRKRPDYGNATPEDLARALMNAPRRKARYRQRVSGKATSSRPATGQRSASDPESQTLSDCASRQTPEPSDQDA